MNQPEFLGSSNEAAPRVLVADDDLIHRMMTVGQLRKLGYYADAVEDGAKAVHAVQNCSYVLVLMDCGMPVMDGYQAAVQIRALGFWSLPIVALTAFTVQENRETCLNSGMDDFLCKPLDLQELAEVLTKFSLPYRAPE